MCIKALETWSNDGSWIKMNTIKKGKLCACICAYVSARPKFRSNSFDGKCVCHFIFISADAVITEWISKWKSIRTSTQTHAHNQSMALWRKQIWYRERLDMLIWDEHIDTYNRFPYLNEVQIRLLPQIISNCTNTKKGIPNPKEQKLNK